MKTTGLFFIAAAAIALASCNRQDDNSIDLKTIAGTYSGYAAASFQYSELPMFSPGQSLTIAEEDGKTVSLSYESDTWGTFTFTGVTVAEDNGKYSLNGEGTTVMGMSAEQTSEYPCSLSASISASLDEFEFVFDVPGVMGGLKITFVSGEMPAGYAVTGTYTGTLALSVMGSDMGTVEDSQVIIDGTGEQVSLTLKGFGLESMGMSIGDITIGDVTVDKDGAGYRLTIAETSVTVGELNVVCHAEGTVSDGRADIVFGITPGAMPMEITATFSGSTN